MGLRAMKSGDECFGGEGLLRRYDSARLDGLLQMFQCLAFGWLLRVFESGPGPLRAAL